MAQKKNRSEGEQTPDDVTGGVFLLGLSVDGDATMAVCEGCGGDVDGNGNDTRSLSPRVSVSLFFMTMRSRGTFLENSPPAPLLSR